MFAALSERQKDALPEPFRGFPNGSCHPASEVLGRYLRETFRLEPQVVQVVAPLPSHAWLEVDGLIIDVTGDQFDQEPVVVTSDSQWHRRFLARSEPQDVKREPLGSWGEEWWNTWCEPVFARWMKFIGG